MPVTKPPVAARDTVFISHAMPEDTDFGVWLSVQLARQGYRVWSEATKLVGGERFWNDIQEAFQTSIVKAVFVVSRASAKKDGVQNEIDYARATAKRIGVTPEKFMQAIALDDLHEAEFPMQLAGRNAIYFNESWSGGLEKLLKVLLRDQVPVFADDVVNLGEWVRDQFSEGRRPLPLESTVTTNACRITAFPENVWFYEFKAPFDAKKPDAFRDFIPWPSFMHSRLLGTFATPDEVFTSVSLSLGASIRAKVATLDFIDGGCKDPALDRQTARNGIVSMMRQAWDGLCRARNLRSMELSSRSTGWFHPAIDGHEKTYAFTDLDGRRRKKALNGVKTKKDLEGPRQIMMRWHYAPSARFAIGYENSLTLVSHVAFTTDGEHPIGDAKKAHKTRRSFCKSWYNEQWRTLHLAYVSSLKGDAEGILVPVSSIQVVTVAGQPWSLISPASFEPPPLKRRPASDIAAKISEADEANEAVPDEDEDLEPADEGDWNLEDEE